MERNRKSFWRPRTIRQQLILGLLLVKVFSILFFVLLLLQVERKDMLKRSELRVEYLTNSLLVEVRQAFEQGQPSASLNAIQIVTNSPSTNYAKVTDPTGKTIYANPESLVGQMLTPVEQEKLQKLKEEDFVTYTIPDQRYGDLYAGVRPVYSEGKLCAYVWVYTNPSLEKQQMSDLLRVTAMFVIVWLVFTLLLVWILASSITRPLDNLLRGTRAIIHSPESLKDFPLPITSNNEVADLTIAFNLMVAAIEEQRSGLRDTLSLLDSMLAHAPIGFAFLDRRCRFVRINGFFTQMMGHPNSRYIGRTIYEMLPETSARELEAAAQSVFQTGEPVVDMELNMLEGAEPDQRLLPAGKNLSWLTRIYPVKSSSAEIGWVGVIAMDTSERKRSEEAMRRTEKLAATGRLAASIAHEINNPLEAVTNLLYLLRNHTALDSVAYQYATLAEHELRRVSEITQQTLRFYRQSSHATETNLCELMDSILNLNHGRLLALDVRLKKEYASEVQLYCYSGEIRQVFANLVGNALDAMPTGGELRIRIRRTHSWLTGWSGVRVTVADTGSGMTSEVRKRIFDAFFTTKEVTGTGLGLWVSNEIIGKHQGLVQVRSRVAGKGHASGSVFFLFFPDREKLTGDGLDASLAADTSGETK